MCYTEQDVKKWCRKFKAYKPCNENRLKLVKYIESQVITRSGENIRKRYINMKQIKDETWVLTYPLKGSDGHLSIAAVSLKDAFKPNKYIKVSRISC